MLDRVNPEGQGWAYGDRIGASEIHLVVAAFNGGFKLSYGSVGFVSGGRVAVPLTAGLASIVTYSNGTTQIGSWRQGVPTRGLKIASVLQNLHLLVDYGAVASDASSCVNACWGNTLGGGADVARSALGISREGQLVWAMIGQALVMRVSCAPWSSTSTRNGSPDTSTCIIPADPPRARRTGPAGNPWSAGCVLQPRLLHHPRQPTDALARPYARLGRRGPSGPGAVPRSAGVLEPREARPRDVAATPQRVASDVRANAPACARHHPRVMPTA
jgi:hypothetical protein